MYEQHGPPDVLRVVEAPDPHPGPGEVLVRVEACGVNRLDALQRSGPPVIGNFALPHVPGMDIAGTVVASGASDHSALVGRRVVVKSGIHCGRCPACASGETHRCGASRLLGGNAPGGYAELCLVPASHVFDVPDEVTLTTAATVPTGFATAWRGLVVTGGVRVGEWVMINGAGSGVSTFAIQIAKLAGARVVVTSRSEDRLRRAIELGADAGVNTTDEELVAEVVELTGGGADLVFDHVGAAMFQASIQCLKPGGRLAFCGTTTGAQATFSLPMAYHKGVTLLGVPNLRHTEFEPMLAKFWQSGIEPVIDEAFPLERAADAHVRLERGDVFGKLVLIP